MQAEFPPPDALALWLVNVVDHNQSPLMMACTSLNRNRTPPRTRTGVKRPQFASRSIVRTEHATFSPGSFFLSSRSLGSKLGLVMGQPPPFFFRWRCLTHL